MQDNFYLFNLKKVQFTFKYAFLQEKDVELTIKTNSSFLKYIEYSTKITKKSSYIIEENESNELENLKETVKKK